MKQKNRVIVKINGQEYPVVGAEPKEYLLKVSSFVDDKMETVAKSNENLSTSMIAVLTSINIADQYLKIKADFDRIKKELEQSRLKTDELERHVEALYVQLDEKDEAYSNLEKRIEEFEANEQGNGKIDLLKEELSKKENDLEKAQALINDLQNKLFANQIKLVETTNELDQYIRKSEFPEE